MKLALISPPEVPPYCPTMAIVALKSYLQEKGVSVVPIDANVDGLHFLLDPKNFSKYSASALPVLKQGLPENVRQRLDQRRVIDMSDDPVPPLDEKRFRTVSNRLKDLWTEDGFALSKDNYFSELAILNDALILMSLRMSPHPLTVWGDNEWADVWRTRTDNPYFDYFRHGLLPKIRQEAPDAIGISVIFGNQLVYGLVLVAMLRSSGITTPVVVGGSYFEYFCKNVEQQADFVRKADGKLELPTVSSSCGSACGSSLNGDGEMRFRIPEASDEISPLGFVAGFLGALDPFTWQRVKTEGVTVGVRGEGEDPLWNICQRIQRDESLHDVPSVVYVDPKDSSVVFNPRDSLHSLSQPVQADLTGMGIGKKYLSPVPMAPLETNRGCYWNKCTFCNFPQTLDGKFREIAVDPVVDSMEAYINDFGVELVWISDECISPRMLRALTTTMTERNLYLPFWTMARIEKSLIGHLGPASKVGLKYVALGLESVNERVSELMKKGDRENAVLDKMFDECISNGVRVHFFVMFGFPTETEAEANETVDYLQSVREDLHGIRLNAWEMSVGSPVMAFPEEYGIAPIEGKVFSEDPKSYEVQDGINRNQARQYCEHVRTHPQLTQLVVQNGQEDFRAVADMVKSYQASRPLPVGKKLPDSDVPITAQ